MNRDRITVEDADKAVTFTLKQLQSEGYTSVRYENGSVVYIIHNRGGTELGRLAVFSTRHWPGVLIGKYCPAKERGRWAAPHHGSSDPTSPKNRPDQRRDLYSEFEKLCERVLEDIEKRSMKDIVSRYGTHRPCQWMSLPELELLVLTSSRRCQTDGKLIALKPEELQLPHTRPKLFKNRLLKHLRKATDGYTRQFPLDVKHEYFHQFPADSRRHLQLLKAQYIPPDEEDDPLFETEASPSPGSHLVKVSGQYCIVTERASGHRSDCCGAGVMMQFELAPGALETIQVTAACLYPEVVDCLEELLDAIREDYETAKQVMTKWTERKELVFGQLHADIFEQNQRFVDVKLGELCPDALDKFVSAQKRVREEDPES